MVSKDPLWSANGFQNIPYGLHIICSVWKFLSMVESSKATDKDYTKLLVIDEMVGYVLKKYRKNWNFKDEITDVILEDLLMKYGKNDKGKEKKEHHDQLKVNKDLVLFNDVKYPLTDTEIKMCKERPTRSKAPTRQVASTSTRSRAPTASTRSRAPTASTFTRSKAPTASTSIRSRALTASTFNTHAVSTSAPRAYSKIAMTRCILGLKAPNDPNGPPLAPRKKKSSS
nr:hypothetical protein [Tanacetum cinerariifolium]